MAEEPSAKRQRGDTSDQSSNLNDIHVPGEKLDYTTTLEKVDLHGKETLKVVCTSEPDNADEMIRRLGMKGGGLYPSFIGVDVEFIRKDEPLQMATVLQLCMEELCLVYYIAAATKWPKHLKEILKEENLYTFVGFSIKDDKEMLKKSGLEINPNNFIDIQRNLRLPNSRIEYDSLVDVAACVIHPFYKAMKKKIDREEDHKLWRISPLPDYLIEYAVIDAYATYQSWKKIDNIKTGMEISKEQE